MEKYKNKIDPDASPKKWYLIGNKKDLDIKREGVPNYYKARFDNYFEVSAKNSKNDEFQRIIDIIAYDIHKSEKESRSFNPENDKKEPFEIDFIKSHGDLFDEECIIF